MSALSEAYRAKMAEKRKQERERKAAYVVVVTIEVPVTLTGRADEFEGTMREAAHDQAIAYLRTRLPVRMREAKIAPSAFRSHYVYPEQMHEEGALPTDGYRVALGKVMA